MAGASASVQTRGVWATVARVILAAEAHALGLHRSQNADERRRIGAHHIGLLADIHPIGAAALTAARLLVDTLVHAEHDDLDIEQLLQLRQVIGSESVQFHGIVVGRSVRRVADVDQLRGGVGGGHVEDGEHVDVVFDGADDLGEFLAQAILAAQLAVGGRLQELLLADARQSQ